jgi:cysteinyl-tRNA synthetase
VSLQLYDTATRSVRVFTPREPGRVSVYLCGLTVQAGPHIGHLRSGVNYDVLRRWLLHSGYDVTFIRNITDIDDKVLAKSVAAGQQFWTLAYANERVLSATYDSLNVMAPTYEPRATGCITEMHELMTRLIEKGHAYVADDGSGDVYFDVRSFPAYGSLSGQRIDEMEPATDAPPRAKRDPRDFALWKGVKIDEPVEARWASPWGPGRPGWHIECSAMCWRFLGEEFDIHGGGLDLRFPHHENEIAQSHAAGLPFARFWVHHALLRIGDAKMANSVGNVISLESLVAKGIRPVEVRYYLLAPHYRSPIDYSDSALREAAAGYQRIENFLQRAAERLGAVPPGELPAEFTAAMDDDLNTSRALAAVHEAVRAGNAALSTGYDEGTREALATVRAMTGVLGVDPFDPLWSDPGGARLEPVVDALVALALEQRAAARARRDWPAADAIRDQLRAAGVVVEDTPNGPRWTVDAR